MFKFFLFITLILIINSCVINRPITIYDKTYINKELVIDDIYKSFNVLYIDSIPINDWMVIFNEYEDNGYSITRFIRKENNKDIVYLIFKTVYSDTTQYEFRINYYSKDNNILHLNLD